MFNKLKKKTKVLMISAMVVVLILVPILIVLLLVPSIQIATPIGFAVNENKTNANQFIAVSPEGVNFQIKIIDNKPKQNLDFWKQALKNKLDQSGYTFLYEQDIISGKNSGIYFEWGAPLENNDYVYTTALIVIGKHIAVCESAGERSLLESYRKGFVESLGTFQYR